MKPLLSPDYHPNDKEPFMNPMQLEYFRQKLLGWKSELLKESNETLSHLQEESLSEPDIADRASLETDRALELRTRDRERKLIQKIDEAPRSPADRHPLDRGAGAPRAHGAHAPRRLKSPARLLNEVVFAAEPCSAAFVLAQRSSYSAAHPVEARMKVAAAISAAA